MILYAKIDDNEDGLTRVAINVTDLTTFVHAGPDATVFVEEIDTSNQYGVRKKQLQEVSFEAE
jgi:hypothetical protein